MKRRIAVLLSGVLLFPLAACGSTKESAGPEIWYAVRSDEGYGQAAVAGETWDDGPETLMVETLFDRMLTPPEDETLYLIFPEKLTLLGWTEEEGLLTVDLSESYSELSGIDLTLANYCLTLTLSQLEGVDRVAVTVEGRPLPEGGDGPFAKTDILLSGEVRDPVTAGFTLYYPRLDGEGLGWVYRETELYGDTPAARAEAVLTLLTAGSASGSDLRDPFAGLEPLPALTVEEGTCDLTLTEDWVQVLTEDEAAQNALTESLCACDGIESVAFRGSSAGG